MNGICPCCLTVAGSDSGGNAGVQADLRTFHHYGVHGCTVFTALTAQNPFGVSAVHQVPADFVVAQLDAVMGVYSVAAVKTGMLWDPHAIETIAAKLSAFPGIPKVVDPVMVATSGAHLIEAEAVHALKRNLLPMATVMTPNIPEAEELSGIGIRNRHDVREAAKRLNGEYGCAVLVKGGHAACGDVTAEDTLFDGTEFSAFSMPWIDNPVSTHGTGCSLASAIAAALALGKDLRTAVGSAKAYVHHAVATSYLVGENCGVLGY
jgi:hydroxymethylpyrimidine kinase/phosphomethylpyrimidine kinase